MAYGLSDELLRRQDHLLERRHKQARFRDPERSLDTVDVDCNKKMNRALIHELATGRFIAHREDALFLGPPGQGRERVIWPKPSAAMRRYERASTLLTSNRPVDDWGKLLSDTRGHALLGCREGMARTSRIGRDAIEDG